MGWAMRLFREYEKIQQERKSRAKWHHRLYLYLHQSMILGGTSKIHLGHDQLLSLHPLLIYFGIIKVRPNL